jgi:TolB-like protein
MPPAPRAVFLSYASEDAAAAQRIAEALRSSGIEVWFDKSELRGGDAWDRQIRQQIHDCRLFIAVISAHTETRDEGYFRREWSLAVDRTRDMAHTRAFLVPIVIDGTSERGASVPEKFHELQWTRLPGGETPPTFVERIRRLLVPEASPDELAAASAGATTAPASTTSPRPPRGSKPGLWITIAVLAVALAYIAVDKLWVSRHSPPPTTSAALPSQTATEVSATAAAFTPPQHSIAVLPFVNMSGDKEQEYFSDGLTEELLNSLARINDLQVAARTSAFSFKGKDTDIGTIARKLNVGTVLEGSVRRSAHRVRVTAQLINAVTGFHMWSQTYDRNLGDVLKLESEIAESVAGALKLTLLGDLPGKIELGGTRNAGAFDAYLRAAKAHETSHDEKEAGAALDLYTEAIHLDPNFALAYAGRSLALSDFAASFKRGPAYRATLEEAKAYAAKALALAPQLAEGHLASAVALETSLDFAPAREEFQRALTLAPGNARVLRNYGLFAVFMGEGDSALTAARRAVVLDPLNPNSHNMLASSLLFLRRYQESLAAFVDTHALDPEGPDSQKAVGWVYYLLGNLPSARSSCETNPQTWFANWCLAVIYDKLGRRGDAQVMLDRLRAARGDDGAYEYAVVYAQWGDRARALDWAEKAMLVHEPKLERVRVNPLLDPLRSEPRFQAIERALRFP